MEYAFNKRKVAALFTGHNPNNNSSRNLLLKLGFRYTHDEFYPPTGSKGLKPLIIMSNFFIHALKGVAIAPTFRSGEMKTTKKIGALAP